MITDELRTHWLYRAAFEEGYEQGYEQAQASGAHDRQVAETLDKIRPGLGAVYLDELRKVAA